MFCVKIASKSSKVEWLLTVETLKRATSEVRVAHKWSAFYPQQFIFSYLRLFLGKEADLWWCLSFSVSHHISQLVSLLFFLCEVNFHLLSASVDILYENKLTRSLNISRTYFELQPPPTSETLKSLKCGSEKCCMSKWGTSGCHWPWESVQPRSQERSDMCDRRDVYLHEAFSHALSAFGVQFTVLWKNGRVQENR